MDEPFNLVAHEFLCSQGYTHERAPEDWEDVGDPENGPRLVGGPAYDIYITDDHYVVILDGGETHMELRDKVFEEWVDAMYDTMRPGYGS